MANEEKTARITVYAHGCSADHDPGIACSHGPACADCMDETCYRDVGTHSWPAGVDDGNNDEGEQMESKSFGFEKALSMLKFGYRMARAGWNGKGMWLTYQPGYPDGIPINANTAKATGLPEGTVCKFLPYIMMRTVDGSFVPWQASQADVLAEDWSDVV